jgi:hypothetical protein
MSRTDWAIDRIRQDHNAGRITADERAQLVRAVTKAASAGRSVSAVLDTHAKERSR